MKKLSLFLVAASMACLVACSGGSESSSSAANESQSETETVEEEAPQASAELTQKMETGKTVYNTYCIACHQADGSGVPGAFPPLQETEWVNGETDTLISIVLNGLQGEITVKGQTYNSVMTAHNFLSDDEVAGVLTYVRKSFGNNSSEITAEEVAEIRGAEVE
ncbi:mono/diheme cytochrome c family protein [Catalinimonas alkaloidigena]|uniref:c-type cytochrome n=1 Tax=Catalinimonas alkaloidigena TaxID=1075417 RepID=UPI002407575A|nr:cytochrome c [Catalinimonas alkaloidigena]MDF9796034.1 mono/diheme cytochrome c family protein [Catalinimonas alkaloidigena]